MGNAAVGANNLGVARGSIQIDTRDLRSVQATARAVGQDVARSLGQIDAGAKRAMGGIAQLNAGIGRMRGELVALGLGGAVLTRIGMGAAAGFEEAEIQLTGLVGSTLKATALIEDLRKKAAAAGVPFKDMLSFATQMLPTLEGNTDELEKWFDVVRRTATLNRGPMGGIGGATFSIREAMLSAEAGGRDFISLADRFNISKAALNQALDQTGGDFVAAMDIVLDRMGITTETADKMGKTFNASLAVAKDAAVQLLAEGFTPLLQTLTPLLQGTAAWLAEMREGNPALANMSAGLITVATVGAPTLLLINQLTEAWLRLGRAGRSVALGGLAIAAAPSVGNAAGNLVNRLRGEDPVSMEEVSQRFRNVIFNWTVTVMEWDMAVKRATASIQMTVNDWQAGMLNGLAWFLRGLSDMFPWELGGRALANAAAGPAAAAGRQGAQNAQIQADLAAGITQRWQDLATLGRRLNIEGFRAPSADAGEDDGGRAAAEAQINQDIIDAKVQYANAVQSIEREAGQARVDATRQYEQQRSQVIAQYELNIVREAEDFGRQRARQAEQLERQIADVRADAAEREAEWWQDLGERIGEIRADGNERITEMERDYARNRERAAGDHRDNLLNAAGRLDAVAVLNEQKRFARQSQDQDETHQERLAKERENMAERIADEQQAHQERLEDARRADARRIEDMRASQAEQQRIEDEDRAIRLGRQADDHQSQLEQMATAHGERLEQISRHAGLERAALDDAHEAELAELGLHNVAWATAQNERQDAALEAWREYWTDWYETQHEALKAAGLLYGPQERPSFPTTFEPTQVPGFAQGGPVQRTGLARVHAGEYVLNPGMAAAVRSAMGGGFSQQGLVNALAGGRGGSTINLADGAIQVFAAPGMDELALAQAVRREMQGLFEELQN